MLLSYIDYWSWVLGWISGCDVECLSPDSIFPAEPGVESDVTADAGTDANVAVGTDDLCAGTVGSLCLK